MERVRAHDRRKRIQRERERGLLWEERNDVYLIRGGRLERERAHVRETPQQWPYRNVRMDRETADGTLELEPRKCSTHMKQRERDESMSGREETESEQRVPGEVVKEPVEHFLVADAEFALVRPEPALQ